MNENEKRSAFSGKLGFVLSAAGASVGLGNIWRFPYLAAKYGGGIFLLIYIILALNAGPALMFITIPKVFDSMGFGTVIGILFFLLVLFAAVTSSIALTESAVSTLQDELGWGRKKSTAIMGLSMLLLGTLSCLGYGPWSNITIIGMQFLDFFDFLTNSVMMPIAAITICILVSKVIGVQKIEEEVLQGEGAFRRKKVFNLMIRFLCPFFAAIILISSVANAFGIISM